MKIKQVWVIGQICLLIVAWTVFAPVSVLAGTDGDTAQAVSSSVSDTDDLAATTATTDEPLYPMSPERYEKLVSYARFNGIWRFVSFFIGYYPVHRSGSKIP